MPDFQQVTLLLTGRQNFQPGPETICIRRLYNKEIFMIYIRNEGLDFQYEISDVIKLFFMDEDVAFTDDEPPADDRRIFILIRAKESGDHVNLSILFRAPGMQCHKESTVPAADEPYEARKLLKREMKRQMYLIFSEYTGNCLPWGFLTGIRPAKIVQEMLEDGKEKQEIMDRLTGYYLVSPDKAQLLYGIAVVERDILRETAPDMISLYIGIPFCPTRCLYCSFTSNPVGKYKTMLDGYMKALEKEMDGVCEIIRNKGHRIQSIYIGGGTPTALDLDNLKRFLESVESKFDLEHVREYTLEAGRPDSLDKDKLKAIRDSRVDRISINPQTMNDDTLTLIGRKHSSEDIITSFGMAREIGFENINMDVIAGLPGEDYPMFEHTMEEIEKLMPESLTVHTMAIKRASRLKTEREKYGLTSRHEVSRMIDLAQKQACTMGMHPYYIYRQKNMLGNFENIGYCRPGLESIYNIQIMEEKQTIIALGAGAVTKAVYPDENRIERAFNVKGVEEYITRVDEMLQRKRALLL